MEPSNFIKLITEKSETSDKKTESILNALTEIIIEETRSGRPIKMTGLGKFSLREGKSDRTGLKFTPGKKVKDTLNNQALDLEVVEEMQTCLEETLPRSEPAIETVPAGIVSQDIDRSWWTTYWL